MKPVLHFQQFALGGVLLFAAMGSSALTLGRARGAALLGQPFQIMVPVQLAPDEDGSGLCFGADVFYGDLRQEASRVSVTPDRNGSGQPTVLRIQSRMPVDEPVVSVYVRSGCGVSTSRRYVLLADLASELSPPLNTVAPLIPNGRTPAAASTGAETAESTTKARVEEAANRAASMAVDAKVGLPPVATVSAAPSTKRLPVAAAQAPLQSPRNNRPKLKLVPLDVSQEWSPLLQSSSELSALPGDDGEKRLAAAALWKTLNLTPEEALRDAARLQSLDQSIGKLSEQTAQTQRQMQALVSRLEKSESEKYANSLVYLLVALLLAMAGGMLWFWRKIVRVGEAPWWGGHANVRDSTAQDAPSEQAFIPTSPLPVASLEVPSRKELEKSLPLADVDIDLNLEAVSPASMSQPVPQVTTERSPSRMKGVRDFQNSMASSLRSINTQDMFDVRQQAEFFMTLGRYDEAISLLEQNIAEHSEPNPLVYLDLLKALHTLSRKEAFDHYRDVFNGIFTGQVPPYTQFNQAGRGLEAYPDLCAHIASVWPSKAALGFIERSLVRGHDAPPQRGYELEAFRELVLLHGLVSSLAGDGTSAAMPLERVKKESQEVDAHTSTSNPPAVDLDLSEPVSLSGNLIEFDASGLSSLTPPLKPRS
ncbi:MAG: hypothetical protein EAZ11_08130 [Curvibacter sp.]|nr:MAG: hypothetical protein EAZ11_08130 [Curvibacter sp.]